jgi:hypothetical protein
LSSGGEKPVTYPTATKEDRHQGEVITALVDAYAKGQGWMLSPEDSSAMQTLLGKNRVAQLACNFSCGSPISVGPNPDTYHIYSHVNDPVWPKESRVDYLTPEERLRYYVNQYRCADMQSLKEKLAQFPLGRLSILRMTSAPATRRSWSKSAISSGVMATRSEIPRIGASSSQILIFSAYRHTYPVYAAADKCLASGL